MEAGSLGEVTMLLKELESGSDRAAERLLPLVYAELRKLASARMSRLGPGQTLQPTALVHEAYLRLVGAKDPGWNGRGHFFGAAALAMRDLIVEAARRKSALKRGGGTSRDDVEVDLVAAAPELPAEDILALDAAILRLKAEHPRKAEVVMLRYFAGLTEEQIAGVLNVTARTVEREWRFARAFLLKELA